MITTRISSIGGTHTGQRSPNVPWKLSAPAMRARRSPRKLSSNTSAIKWLMGRNVISHPRFANTWALPSPINDAQTRGSRNRRMLFWRISWATPVGPLRQESRVPLWIPQLIWMKWRREKFSNHPWSRALQHSERKTSITGCFLQWIQHLPDFSRHMVSWNFLIRRYHPEFHQEMSNDYFLWEMSNYIFNYDIIP